MRVSLVPAALLMFLISMTSSFSAPKGSQRPSVGSKPVYDSCCVCIPDIIDFEVFDSMCKRWLKSSRKEYACEYQQIVSKVLFKELARFTPGDRCRKVHLYGAFHGDSGMTKLPFEFSMIAAKTFQSTQVCYEGATCLVFDNVEDVKACAREVAGGKCHYEISGNQNVGIAASALFCRPREVADASSKLTAVIDGASVRLRYAPCTPEGRLCGYISKTDPGEDLTYQLSKNDPNSKWCIHQDAVVLQTCCVQKKAGKGDPDFGKWSAPGKGCS